MFSRIREMLVRHLFPVTVLMAGAAKDEEKGFEFDEETVTLLVGFGILIVFILGILFYYKDLGGLGVTFIQDIVNVPEAILNGIAGLIDAGFRFLEHLI